MICRTLCVLIFITFFAAASHASALEIPLEKHGDVYSLPILVNGLITLNFVLDSGASEVVIPSNFVSTLLRAGTITERDFLPGKSCRLADGSIMRSSRFTIKELNIRGYRLLDVPCIVCPATGRPLLGQSFLNRMESWTLDNRSHKLILNSPEAKQTSTATSDSLLPPRSGKKKPEGGNDKTMISDTDSKPGGAEPSKPLIPPSVYLDASGQPVKNGARPLLPPRVHQEQIPIRQDGDDGRKGN